MNTNQLKKFAQEARRKLLQQVGAKLELVLTHDTAELREKATQVNNLKDELNRMGRQQLIDKVAYTWFNRLMALRFMDANDYQPSGIRIVSPKDGYTLPQILDEAKQGHFSEEIPVDKQNVLDILDGRIPSNNPQNEAYRVLLVASCNALHQQFRFLFERINDYTELLLPDDMTSEFSIVNDIVNGMKIDDCKQVEIIGWLYQFYISERKDELINAKKRYKKNEIAPVTQLFTPRWIVEYMVDNTLGQYWKEARPKTNLTENLQFYIRPNNPELIPSRELISPEEIKFFDPCVGSGHILCYAFDLFYKMYEEEGYNPSEIPSLILKKNLFGIDIDERASQLAGFALMMKGREKNRRFLKKDIRPNILTFEESESHSQFQNAKTHGSLIKVSMREAENIKVDRTSIFAERDQRIKDQAIYLSDEYDIVVTNPPYLNSSYMEGSLKQYVEKEYKETKSDLFACFLSQVRSLSKNDGLIGFICPYVWMFIKSYEWLRGKIISDSTLTSLVQLEYNAFGPAVVPICTFTLRNEKINNYIGSYIKLSEFRGIENQAPKTIEAIKNPNSSWFFTSNQDDFEKIPGTPIAYWLSKTMIDVFDTGKILNDFASVRQGMATSDNNRFLRNWYEVSFENIGLKCPNRESAKKSKSKWFPYNKGGEFRKWFGNIQFVVNWFNDGEEIKQYREYKNSTLSSNMGVAGLPFIFKPNITWSKVTAGKFSVRMLDKGFLFDVSGCAIYEDKILHRLIALMNSKVITKLLKEISPTLNYEVGHIKALPILTLNYDCASLTRDSIDICRKEYSTRETYWEFQKNELLTRTSQDLEESFNLFTHFWNNKFNDLHHYEVEINRLFIELYGLQDELTPEVPLEEITILKEEMHIENGKLVFHADEILGQFVSYAVGCMFGRYSLDKQGLILSDQGETLKDYLSKVGKSDVSFFPDDDAIIPVLDDEWFEDDIVGRFYEFLKVTYGERDFQKNLAFVEDALGKDIRKYFVKDFYNDHIKRYKKRPIYWMFSSPKGYFNVLIYMHRYTPDTLNNILNNYLREFIQKLQSQKSHYERILVSGNTREQSQATKQIDKLEKMILDCEEYEREILYPLATERISIDLDDGVLVNYNKFGKAVKEVKGLNDKKTKEKVRKFDWIDISAIRD